MIGWWALATVARGAETVGEPVSVRVLTPDGTVTAHTVELPWSTRLDDGPRVVFEAWVATRTTPGGYVELIAGRPRADGHTRPRSAIRTEIPPGTSTTWLEWRRRRWAVEVTLPAPAGPQ